MSIKKTLSISIIILFLHSICWAKDRALLVGIDTYKYKAAGVPDTPGCVQDAKTMKEILTSRFNFSEGSIHQLLNSEATSARIKEELQSWLIKGTEPGDRVFFLYSGHGSQLPDDNGDEKDGLDETVAPYDVNPETGSGEIRDD